MTSLVPAHALIPPAPPGAPLRRRMLVVGASTGLARATARRLVADGHEVVVAGRDPDRTRAAVPGASAALAVDLTRLRDVARLADELAAMAPLDGVVCNAGIQDAGPPTFTPDGHEAVFAVNHLAHFALVARLLPTLAARARVVWIGSGTLDPDDRGARRFGFRGGRYTSAAALAAGAGDPEVSTLQRARDRYATSKLCDLMTMAALADRVPATRLGAFTVDPGLMPGTGLVRQQRWLIRVGWHTVLRAAALVLPRASTPARSAGTIAWALTTPTLDGVSGRYLGVDRRELPLHARARDPAALTDLYTTSLALCGAPDPLA